MNSSTCTRGSHEPTGHEDIQSCLEKEVKSLIIQAANSVRPAIESADLENYIHFLNLMYHYTIVSESQLRDAAGPFVSEDLNAFYIQLAKEENGHYLLAQADLNDLGFSRNRGKIAGRS